MSAFFTCENKNLSLEQVLRTMVYDDGAGNPVISFNPNTTLQKWVDCENKNLSITQIARELIVKDANGNPAWNISNL